MPGLELLDTVLLETVAVPLLKSARPLLPDSVQLLSESVVLL